MGQTLLDRTRLKFNVGNLVELCVVSGLVNGFGLNF
jgi:hypothetical protein